jgi:uncharacterized protein (TIGR03067 family)
MTRRPLYLLAAAALGAAACSKTRPPDAATASQARPAVTGDPSADDLARLQGAWRVESSVWNGAPEPDAARTVTIRFEGDKFVVVDRDGNRMEETIRLFPDQSPKAIDCQGKGGGRVSPGIYSLDGDKLTWCSAGGGKTARPTAFASEPGSRHSLMVLRRVKD